MLLEPIPLEARRPQDSYTAMFSSALLRPERETPSLIASPKGKGVVKRYNVYRNNVTVSLIEALAATFPAVRRITGEEFFRAMARFHIRETPPIRRCCLNMGGTFPRSSPLMSTRRTCPGLPMWRASSAPGSMPITPRTRSRCRRPPLPPFRPSGSPISFSRRIRRRGSFGRASPP